MPTWQEGFSRPGDVLAGVHERHVSATYKAFKSGSRMASEKQVLDRVGRILASGQSVGGWNVEFDFSVLEDVARRTGDSTFMKGLNRAWTQGKIVEMSDPARRFLFNLAREGAIELGQTSKAAKALASRPGTTPGNIAALTMQEMFEPHEGFRRLFQKRPNISYEEYKTKLYAERGLEDVLGVQEFSEGLRRPKFRYVKGWRQHVLAEAISPGFLRDPTSTQMGQEIAKRLNLRQGEKVTAHLARDDTVLTGILHEIFGAKDPWSMMSGYGVKSRGQFLTQYGTALEQDIKHTLGTYLGEQSRDAMDIAYLRKVLSGAEEMGLRASDVARKAADPGHRFPGFAATAKGTLQEVMAASRKYPRASAAVSVVGTMLIAGSLIPQDNKLQGRRRPDSRYNQIQGINFGGIGAPATHALTDFGSGRSEDNAASQIRAWKMVRDTRPSEFRGHAVGEIETAQYAWSEAKSQRNRRNLDRSVYEIRRGAEASIPGVKSNVPVGVMDLTNYRAKAEGAGIVNLYRRGLLHVFDKPISVRMAGIDAPETHPEWPSGMKAMGTASGEYLQTLINQQTTMSLLIDPNRTSYGRHAGVLSGDVHPNINLKLVSAGAAAALPDRSGITTAKAYERAETIASASGLGMWSSKGWQAKRALDMAVSGTVSTASRQNIKRTADRAGLEGYDHLVQDLHDSPKPGVWEEAELDALTQVMATRQSTSQWDVNAEIKRHGWRRGIRDGSGPWNIVDPGIAPSDLPRANVSAFGSGWTRRGAESVQRLVDPLRRRFMPRAEPILKPSAAKSASTSFIRTLRDKARASLSLLHRVGPRTAPAYKAQHVILKPALNKAAADVSISAASTSVGLTRPKTVQRRLQSFLGSMYSVPQVPWRSLNEYQAVKGWGFSGNWHARAWQALKAGDINLVEFYRDMSQALQEKGLSRDEAKSIIRRYWPRGAAKARNKVETPGFWARLASGIQRFSIATQPDRIGSWWNRAKLFGAERVSATRGTHGIYATLKGAALQELGIRKILWRETVGAGKGILGKIGGFLEFAMEAGRGITTEGPKPLNVLMRDKWKRIPRKPGFGSKVLNWLRGPVRESKHIPPVKAWATGHAARASKELPGLARFGRGLRSVGRRIGGKWQIPFIALEAVQGSSEYRNSALGMGIEAASSAADWAVMGATFGGFSSVGMAIGASVGTAVGTVIGGLFGAGAGAVPGAFIGNIVGSGLGWVVGAATSIALGYITGEGVRRVGGLFAEKRNASPHMPGESFYGPQFPGMSTYGGTDQYLTAGHGIQGRPEFSGFGGGLKPMRERQAVADTLSKTSPKTVGAGAQKSPARLSRPKSQLGPTAGLTNVVLWGNRHRITRGRNRWPVQWEQKRKQTRHASGSRMMRAA
jgi:endonuclease YncB( thermonuclease family)